MKETQDGYAFLEELRRRNAKPQQTFQDFSAYLEEKARAQGVPLSGQFELTPLCNFRCPMCYVHLDREQMAQPLLTAEQWKGLMAQACQEGMLRANLTGGECLTYPGFEEVYCFLQDAGCEVTIMTNGALLDDKWMAFFRRRPPAEFFITLYGDSEEAYQRVTGQRCFAAVTAHIRALREAGFAVRLTVTPNRFLGEDVFNTLRTAKEMCPSVRVNFGLTAPRQETGRTIDQADLTEEEYLRIYRLLRELDGVEPIACPAEKLPKPGGPQTEGVKHGLKCGGGRSTFSVNWRGVMSPCNELEMIKAYPLRDGFAAAWREVHEAAEAWPRAAVCEGCAYEQVCEHCAGRLLSFSKPGERAPALCERTMRFVQQGVFQLPDCE